MRIFKNGPQQWTNLHGTVTQKVTDIYDLANETGGTAIDNYNDTTKGIQDLIRQSLVSGIPLRILGGNWSLSPITATSGIILNTKLLNSRFTVTADSLTPEYKGKPERLVMAQCGMSVWELNDYLHERGLSLSACGASNGQTIVGAMSTGTHGAAVGFGAIQEAVVGLHLITGPDRHIWLERASAPVVQASFAEKLGAELVRDDEAFYAALVSFGSFGFIHGVLLEAEPEYLLECYLRRVPIDEAYYKEITTLAFTHPSLPYPGVKPFHYQTLINPYDLAGGAYMTTMYKQPYRTDYTPPAPNGDGIGPGDDAPCFIGKLAGVVPGLVPTLVNKVLATSLTPFEKKYGRLGEIFNNTTLRGKVTSTAIGMPVSEVRRVIGLLLELNKTAGPFAGLFAFRFVKASKATLAFTRFDPTCVLELDGVQSKETDRFYKAVWQAFEQEGIPHTFHWGKVNPLDAGCMRRIYGASLDRFLVARARIMDAGTLGICSNTALRDWGIDAMTAEATSHIA